MKVLIKHDIPNDPGHSIEWGNSTWGQQQNPIIQQRAIRNRFENSNGGFNQAASSELPWDDFLLMIQESINQNQFTTPELITILKTIAAKL
jgi:hypothetical protein